MSIVVILCPKTGVQISTGIETDLAGFSKLPSTQFEVDCWACGGRHTWSRRWATLLEADAPTDGRAGIPVSTPAEPHRERTAG